MSCVPREASIPIAHRQLKAWVGLYPDLCERFRATQVLCVILYLCRDVGTFLFRIFDST